MRSIAARVVRPLLLVVLIGFWAIYLWQNASLLLTNTWTFDLPWFLVAVACGAVTYGCYAVGWVYGFRALGGTISWRRGVKRWFQSLIMRYTPGGFWHVAGRAYLLREDGHPVHLVLVAAVVEQGMTVLAAVVVAGGGLLGAPIPTEPAAHAAWLEPAMRATGVALLAAGGVSLVPAVFCRWIWIASWPVTLVASRVRGPDDMRVDYPAVFHAAVARLDGRTLALGLMPWLGGMLAAAGSTASTGLALGVDAATMLRLGPAVFAIAWLAGFIVLIAPTGLGARELIVVLLMEPFSGPAVGIALAGLSRVAFTAGELLAVLAVVGRSTWRLVRTRVRLPGLATTADDVL